MPWNFPRARRRTADHDGDHTFDVLLRCFKAASAVAW
jgi:hypothetical protein